MVTRARTLVAAKSTHLTPSCFHPAQGGKRKSKKKVVAKIKEKVATTFKCPYCAHNGSCEVVRNKEAETGSIKCRVCGEGFQTRIHQLTDPVDVSGARAQKAKQEGPRGNRRKIYRWRISPLFYRDFSALFRDPRFGAPRRAPNFPNFCPYRAPPF